MFPTSVVGLFCEDIRQEQGGQITLIGILPDNMAVPEVPGALPKLGVYVRVSFDPKHPPSKVISKLILPDSSAIEMQDFDPGLIHQTAEKGVSDGAPVVGLLLQGLITPFHLASFGRMNVQVEVDGQTYIACTLKFLRA